MAVFTGHIARPRPPKVPMGVGVLDSLDPNLMRISSSLAASEPMEVSIDLHFVLTSFSSSMFNLITFSSCWMPSTAAASLGTSCGCSSFTTFFSNAPDGCIAVSLNSFHRCHSVFYIFYFRLHFSNFGWFRLILEISFIICDD